MMAGRVRALLLLLWLAATAGAPAAEASRAATFPELLELAGRHETVDLARALGFAEQAHAAARTPNERARADLRRGSILRRRGDYEAALATARAGVAQAVELRDEELQAEFLRLLGHVEWSVTNFPAALENYQRAAELAERIGRPATAARAHSGAGSTYRDLDDFAHARQHYEKALAFAERADDPVLLSDILNNFGNYHFDAGDTARSVELHRRALALREAAGSAAGMADSFFNLGTAAAQSGNLEEALAFYGRAQQLYETLGFVRNLANLHHNIAGVLRRLGRTDEGLEHLAAAQKVGETLNASLLSANIHREYAATYAARGEHAKAFEHQARFIEANEKVRGEKTQRQVAALNVRFETERRQHEIARLRSDRELREAELRRVRQQRYMLVALLGVGVAAGAAVASRQRLKRATERRVLEETCAAKEAAERADAFKTKLVGIASHDLKAPVAALIGAAESLQRDAGDPAAVTAMARLMVGEGRRMLTLIRDLLDLAALETGRLELDRSPVAIASVARDCVEMLEVNARAKQQTLTCVIEPEAERVCVSADPERIRQVVTNLLDNAIKFTPPGKPVRVVVAIADGMVRVAVQDAGPGLAPEDYVRVFQPFQKLSARPTGGESSTGLGLSIAREIVALHGGQMVIESTPGEGATFGFVLPRAVA